MPSQSPVNIKQLIRTHAGNMRVRTPLFYPLGMIGAPMAVVGFRPNDAISKPFSGPSHQVWRDLLNGMNINQVQLLWQTYLVKTEPYDAALVTRWRKLLFLELEKTEPRAVLLLGGLVAKHLLGTGGGRTDEYRQVRYLHPKMKAATFFVTYSIEEVITNKDEKRDMIGALRDDFNAVAQGNPEAFPEVHVLGGGDATRPSAE